MTKKELVEKLSSDASGIEEFIYDASKDDLRRLALELNAAFYNATRRLAHLLGRDMDEVKLEIYGGLADGLTDAWTYNGEWDEE